MFLPAGGAGCYGGVCALAHYQFAEGHPGSEVCVLKDILGECDVNGLALTHELLVN